MAPPALRARTSEVTRDTHDTLEAALEVFNGPDSTTAPAGGRQQLRDLAEKHKQAVAKAVLLVSGSGGGRGSGASASPAVTSEELRGVLASVQQSAIALCGCCHGFTGGSGPSLKQSLKQLCGGVMAPTRELVDKLESADAEGLRRAFGLVWGACDELTRGPLDNKASLFRQLADVMQGIKGAAKELDELCDVSRQELGLAPAAEAAAVPGSGSCNGGGGGAAAAQGPGGGGAEEAAEGRGAAAAGRLGERAGEEAEASKDEDGEEEEEKEEEEEEDDSDDFRDMGSLSATELATAEAAAALLAAAQSALRLISRPLLEGPALSAGPALEQWESLIWHSARLRSSCEALVACLYPPHDELDELAGESEAVATSLELMLGELPESHFGVIGGEEEEEEEEGGAGGGAPPPAPSPQVQQLQQQVAAVQREVEAAAGRMAEELLRRGRPAGGA
ncbi:hypothetical protein PLESTM_000926800 [Pleodorina starrii]|nr:hypothetical protein PLESTM_000926800 [Pleodorina starrii]